MANAQDYSNNLLDAMSIIADNAVKNLPYDKTITCLIEARNIDKSYTVSYENAQFRAIPNNISDEYQVGDKVRVTIPQGDMTQEKIIMGLARTYSQLTPADEEDLYFDSVKNGFMAMRKFQFNTLTNNSPTDSINILSTISEKQMPTQPFNQILFELKIKSSPKTADKVLSGRYRVDITVNDITYPFGFENFLGNPYDYFFPAKQIIKFDIPEYKEISKIQLDLIFDDGLDDKLNIEIIDANLSFGYDISKITEPTVALYTYETIKYNNAVDGITKKNAFIRFIDIDANGNPYEATPKTTEWYIHAPGRKEADEDGWCKFNKNSFNNITSQDYYMGQTILSFPAVLLDKCVELGKLKQKISYNRKIYFKYHEETYKKMGLSVSDWSLEMSRRWQYFDEKEYYLNIIGDTIPSEIENIKGGASLADKVKADWAALQEAKSNYEQAKKEYDELVATTGSANDDELKKRKKDLTDLYEQYKESIEKYNAEKEKEDRYNEMIPLEKKVYYYTEASRALEGQYQELYSQCNLNLIEDNGVQDADWFNLMLSEVELENDILLNLDATNTRCKCSILTESGKVYTSSILVLENEQFNTSPYTRYFDLTLTDDTNGKYDYYQSDGSITDLEQSTYIRGIELGIKHFEKLMPLIESISWHVPRSSEVSMLSIDPNQLVNASSYWSTNGSLFQKRMNLLNLWRTKEFENSKVIQNTMVPTKRTTKKNEEVAVSELTKQLNEIPILKISKDTSTGEITIPSDPGKIFSDGSEDGAFLTPPDEYANIINEIQHRYSQMLTNIYPLTYTINHYYNADTIYNNTVGCTIILTTGDKIFLSKTFEFGFADQVFGGHSAVLEFSASQNNLPYHVIPNKQYINWFNGSKGGADNDKNDVLFYITNQNYFSRRSFEVNLRTPFGTVTKVDEGPKLDLKILHNGGGVGIKGENKYFDFFLPPKEKATIALAAPIKISLRLKDVSKYSFTADDIASIESYAVLKASIKYHGETIVGYYPLQVVSKLFDNNEYNLLLARTGGKTSAGDIYHLSDSDFQKFIIDENGKTQLANIYNASKKYLSNSILQKYQTLFMYLNNNIISIDKETVVKINSSSIEDNFSNNFSLTEAARDFLQDITEEFELNKNNGERSILKWKQPYLVSNTVLGYIDNNIISSQSRILLMTDSNSGEKFKYELLPTESLYEEMKGNSSSIIKTWYDTVSKEAKEELQKASQMMKPTLRDNYLIAKPQITVNNPELLCTIFGNTDENSESRILFSVPVVINSIDWIYREFLQTLIPLQKMGDTEPTSVNLIPKLSFGQEDLGKFSGIVMGNISDTTSKTRSIHSNNENIDGIMGIKDNVLSYVLDEDGMTGQFVDTIKNEENKEEKKTYNSKIGCLKGSTQVTEGDKTTEKTTYGVGLNVSTDDKDGNSKVINEIMLSQSGLRLESNNMIVLRVHDKDNKEITLTLNADKCQKLIDLLNNYQKLIDLLN